MAHLPVSLCALPSSPPPRGPHLGRRSPMVCPLAKLGRSSPAMEHLRYRCSPGVDVSYRRSPLEPAVYTHTRGAPSPLDPAVYTHTRSAPSPLEPAVYTHTRGAPSPLEPAVYTHTRGAPSPLEPAVYTHTRGASSPLDCAVYNVRRTCSPPNAPSVHPMRATPSPLDPAVYTRVPPPTPLGGFRNLSSTSPGSMSETSVTTYHPEMTSYMLPEQLPSRPLTDVGSLYQHRLLSQDPLRSSPALRRASSPTSEHPFLYQTPLDNYRVGRSSPCLDQGYHTLVSPSPGPAIPGPPWTDFAVLLSVGKGKKVAGKGPSLTERLPDAALLCVFSWLTSRELCVCAQVCRRWNVLAWDPSLWRTVRLAGEGLCGDRVVRGVLRRLGSDGPCGVQRVFLSDGARLTEKGLTQLARRCPDLTHLQLHSCAALTETAIVEFTARCSNLQHLDLTGCTNMSSLTGATLEPPRLLLQYLDLTDCSAVDDAGLQLIVRSCPQLIYLYLRRCQQVTDTGVKLVPSFCSGLRELSVSDCNLVTDFGLHEVARLGATLRYLSVAKCEQVSDAGLKTVARRCYKLRYLNARGCEAVSDDALTVLARSCPRLRALDIGKCDISDAGLRALAESCPNLKKLSLRSCDLVTDRGVQCVAYYCRGLQQLNIQDCRISLDGYRAVKKYCKRCVIEHTNPGFY